MKSELELDKHKWPEYEALVQAELREERSRSAKQGELLCGLPAPNISEAIVALDALQLSKIFQSDPFLKSYYDNDKFLLSTAHQSRIEKSNNCNNDNRHGMRQQHKIALRSKLDQYPFKVNSSLSDAKLSGWPDCLLVHQHDVYYNRDERREGYEEQCNGVRQRHIRRELASTCTVFNDKDVFVHLGRTPTAAAADVDTKPAKA